ncbi:MAG: bifunctional alpha,alpha-trehalose-phosphate synthase (UDP-forming)/trehalose-phosphatase [Candidatus Bipolaricaulota bacterium]
MAKLIIVSNRLPVTLQRGEHGLEVSPSPGGLATGLASVHGPGRSLWVGWPGLSNEAIRGEEEGVRRELSGRACLPVFLSQSEVRDYYSGFSNRTLWPLFHYFTQHARYDRREWDVYARVNERFADAVAEAAAPGDMIWVQDYQLMLVPRMVRHRLPHATIGFFLHIPFPAYEVFRLLPWRRELLEGALGADVVGLHTYDYVGHFLDAVQAVLGRSHEFADVTLEDGRVARVESFPMGIDATRFETAAQSRDAEKEVARLRRQVKTEKIVLSVDRLDYTKGILERLAAYDVFLEENAAWRGRVTFVLLLVPSRTRVQEYQDLKRQIDELVGRINGQRGRVGWTPIVYLYRSVPFERLVALYRSADVALVTPLRDGMNLVAKEYVACRDRGGALVLSEFAGAARELGGALFVNPNDVPGVALALRDALEMPADEQAHRMQWMKDRVTAGSVDRWAADVLAELAAPRHPPTGAELLSGVEAAATCAEFAAATRRLLLLDLDGTLIPLAAHPSRAQPSAALFSLLERLASDPRNELVLVSGRDKATLDAWFGAFNVGLAAEHGAWIRERGGAWRATVLRDAAWKTRVMPVLERFVRRTPGAWIEEKDFSLVWHYRAAEPAASRLRAPELRRVLATLTANLELHLLDGNGVLEVKANPFHKGQVAAQWLGQDTWDFVLAAGDDRTDEDMFRALPALARTIKVGPGASAARHRLPAPGEMIALLERLGAEPSSRRKR